ncbi:helix-turn-helix transcriptional regulator [Candidatus Regiella endosymbiont of Tuberolachnus salignus]|uniref:helix-turn-helix transcriptional regulator n=1 Tax=Candidatus Regiella endosymbiont of Tuberolachnus salignus TaxID=3077956 RepID=UPI0030CC8FAD
MNYETIPEITIPNELKLILDQVPEPWGIKNLESRFVYANPALIRLNSLKSSSDMVGKIDHEVESTLAELGAESFKEQDRKVFKTKKDLVTLELYPKAVDYPYVVRKYPYFNDKQECIGVVGYVKTLEVCSLDSYVKGSMPGSLLLRNPDGFFDEKECEVIFFRLQGMKCSAIGERLNLSRRTIENRLQLLYTKAGVKNSDEFKCFCEEKNYHRYLPKKFIPQLSIHFEGVTHPEPL